MIGITINITFTRLVVLEIHFVSNRVHRVNTHLWNAWNKKFTTPRYTHYGNITRRCIECKPRPSWKIANTRVYASFGLSDSFCDSRRRRFKHVPKEPLAITAGVTVSNTLLKKIRKKNSGGNIPLVHLYVRACMSFFTL